MSKLDLHTIIIVTDKANHSLAYKSAASAMTAFNTLKTDREKWAVDYNAEPKLASYDNIATIKDDYGVIACPKFATIATVQITEVAKEHEVTNERKMLNMLSDLDYGKMVADSPELREAQAKAAAKSKLALPPGQH